MKNEGFDKFILRLGSLLAIVKTIFDIFRPPHP
jgi:hypothetical protein